PPRSALSSWQTLLVYRYGMLRLGLPRFAGPLTSAGFYVTCLPILAKIVRGQHEHFNASGGTATQVCEHHPFSPCRCGRAGAARTSWHATRRRRSRLRSLERVPALRSFGARLAQPRSLRALGRPCVDAALFAAPSFGARSDARRAAALSPVGIENPRPPRV